MQTTALYPTFPWNCATESCSIRWALITGSLFGCLCLGVYELRQASKRRSRAAMQIECMGSSPGAGCSPSPSNSILSRTPPASGLCSVNNILSTLSPLVWSPQPDSTHPSNQPAAAASADAASVGADGFRPEGLPPIPRSPTCTAIPVSPAASIDHQPGAYRVRLDDELG